MWEGLDGELGRGLLVNGTARFTAVPPVAKAKAKASFDLAC